MERIRGVLHVRDTPHRIALAFAFGVFLGMSPLIGLHTVSAFFIASLLNLNRLVALVGVFITNPWTIVPIYTFCIWVGARLVGLNQILPTVDWSNLSFITMMSELKQLIIPFLVGTIVVGVVSAVVSYFIVHWAVVTYRDVS
jgi:uncharacterized protein (DUF2062 family)